MYKDQFEMQRHGSGAIGDGGQDGQINEQLLDDAWYYQDDDSDERHAELQELRQEERLMQEASRRLEVMAARLLSRAHKLRQRAQELDDKKKRKNGYNPAGRME